MARIEVPARQSRTAAPPGRRHRFWAWAVPVLLLAACASPTTTATLKVEVEVVDALRRYEVVYLLQPGDVVEVFVNRHPEFSRKAIVRSDGMIGLPLVGDVKAAGLTPAALAGHITQRYAPRLNQPETTVIVENPPEPSVYVLGQVAGPRAVPLRQARTLAQALALAGDATKLAALPYVAVIRLNEQGVLEAHRLAGEGGTPSQPELYMAMSSITLRPNDVVLVPESQRSQAMRILQDITLALAPLLNFVILNDATK